MVLRYSSAPTVTVLDGKVESVFDAAKGDLRLNYLHQGLARVRISGGGRPDLTLLLDAPVEIGMSRAQKRGELDRFETEKAAFFSRVRNNYLERAAAEPARFKLVDASLSLELVQEQIRTILETIFSASDQ